MIADDYEDGYLGSGGVFAFWSLGIGSALSYKVTPLGCYCAPTWVHTETHKWNSSPVYERTFDCADEQEVSTPFTLKKLK